jgi:hypothetical protein
MSIFTSSQFRPLGGLEALTTFENRENVFEAVRQSVLIRQPLLVTTQQITTTIV